MPKNKPTWTEKLHNSKGYPKVEVLDQRMSKHWGQGTIVIPAPIEVDELMRQVPVGKVTTINNIRQAIAKKHGATIGCPITTGIFSWIAAHAAEEQRANGEANTTSYWRTLKVGGMLNEKYPGGINCQRLHLESEGHVIFQKGKKNFVKDYEKALVTLY
jgi:hypothetical protein